MWIPKVRRLLEEILQSCIFSCPFFKRTSYILFSFVWMTSVNLWLSRETVNDEFSLQVRKNKVKSLICLI